MKIDLINQTGYINLKSDHSMFLGNKPSIISNEQFSMIIEKEAEKTLDFQLGLFDSSTPNYTTYYPDVTAEDLLPKDEDFIFPIFRCLSETIVWKGSAPIDFSKPGVLKNSMALLVGQTINADHETALGNGMGVVKSVAWQESYTKAGIKVPAGINGEFMIDGKSNPRIARGIMSKPPIIHSNSVGIRFKWEPSHQLKDNEEFFSKLGTKDDKGNFYRLVVSEIVQYSETSLVPHGADPWAQIVAADGKINNPVYAAGVYNFSINDNQGKALKATHSFDYKMDLTLNQDTIPIELIKDNNNQNHESMKLLAILETAFGLTPGSLTEESAEAALGTFVASQLTDLTTKLGTATTTTTALTAENTSLKEDNASLKPLADAHTAALTVTREEAKKNYKLVKGDNAKEEILNNLDACEEALLNTLAEDYKLEAEAIAPMQCQDCKSTNLSRTSSATGEENLMGGKKENLTKDNFKEAFRKNSKSKTNQ